MNAEEIKARVLREIGAGPEDELPFMDDEEISPELGEALRRAQQLSKSIMTNFEYLTDAMSPREGLLQKRWKKKTKEARRKILLAAWPAMPAMHRPDHEAHDKARAERLSDYRDDFMWSHMNQEDLRNERSFLLLLHSRAHYHPDTFAAADLDSTMLGRSVGAIQIRNFGNHQLIFRKGESHEHYGAHLSLRDVELWAGCLYSGGICTRVGDGLVILEVQERIYQLLVDICNILLRDKLQEIASGEHPTDSGPALLNEPKPDLVSWAIRSAEAPYRGITIPNFIRLRSIIRAKLDAAEDHFWALREDPGYFAETMEGTNEHCADMVMLSRGKLPQGARGQPIDRNRICGIEVGPGGIVESLFGVEIWQNLLDKVDNLQRLHQDFTQEDLARAKVSPENLEAIAMFHIWIEKYIHAGAQDLYQSFSISPPMRTCFTFKTGDLQQGLSQENTVQKFRMSPQPTKELGLGRKSVQGRLCYYVLRLQDECMEPITGFEPLLEEIECLVQTNPEARKFISPWISALLEDFTLLAECLRTISIFKHKVLILRKECIMDKNTFYRKVVRESHEKNNIILGSYKKIINSRFERNRIPLSVQKAMSTSGCSPDEKKPKISSVYPVEKPRTRENVVAMQNEERKLDSIWADIDRCLRSDEGLDLDNTAIGKLLKKPRPVHRTSDWTEQEESQQLSGQRRQKSQAEVLDDINELVLRTEKTLTTHADSESKSKEKTRGAPTAVVDVDATPEPIPKLDTPAPFALDKRAFKAIQTLFYQPSTNDVPGEVPWSDFVHAMRSVGFAPEILYGSVWQFSPQSVALDRSIQFHEPHPARKLSLPRARRFGRRLNRRYGWDAKSFVLAKTVPPAT